MRYDITKPTAPKMPNLGKGTECIKILLSQVSKDMYDPLVPMLFPILGAHISGAEFQYPDLSWKELCGQMANLVAESGGNKGQLSLLLEAICRDFRQHDEAELKKLAEWQKQTKGANKDKPADGHKAIAIPSATLLSKKDVDLLSAINSQLSTQFAMYPDRDAPGERLFLQLQAVLPGLVHHQLPSGCKDFSEYYLSTRK